MFRSQSNAIHLAPPYFLESKSTWSSEPKFRPRFLFHPVCGTSPSIVFFLDLIQSNFRRANPLNTPHRLPLSYLPLPLSCKIPFVDNPIMLIISLCHWKPYSDRDSLFKFKFVNVQNDINAYTFVWDLSQKENLSARGPCHYLYDFFNILHLILVDLTLQSRFPVEWNRIARSTQSERWTWTDAALHAWAWRW
jgi:hypothetical protein